MEMNTGWQIEVLEAQRVILGSGQVTRAGGATCAERAGLREAQARTGGVNSR